MYGIIAGTAIYNIPNVKLEEKVLETPFGKTTVFIGQGEHKHLVFLPRHGQNHTTPPHNVNYRANLKALEMIGVKKILAAYAVGSINLDLPPLSMVVLKDFLDFTSNRPKTFFDGGVDNVKHVEMSEPYCPKLSETLIKIAKRNKIELHPSAVYACTNGPRLETPAEIRMIKMLGADVVGMTGVPEVVLAKELNIPFAAVAFSINWAAGIEKTITFYDDGLGQLKENLLTLFIETLKESMNEEVA